MAKNQVRHPHCNPVINRFVENLEKTIALSSIVLSSDIQKHFGPRGETVYLKGRLLFIDSSILEISIFAREVNSSIFVDKYRLHYMEKQNQMLFRYDNAPHHLVITSHPHHKHIPGKIVQSTCMPSLKDVLNEISAIIISK